MKNFRLVLVLFSALMIIAACVIGCGSSSTLEPNPNEDPKYVLDTQWYTVDYTAVSKGCGFIPADPVFFVFYCSSEKITGKECPNFMEHPKENESAIYILSFIIKSENPNYFIYIDDWGNYHVEGRVLFHPKSTITFDYELEIVINADLGSCRDDFIGTGRPYKVEDMDLVSGE